MWLVSRREIFSAVMAHPRPMPELSVFIPQT
jgi:hypothetical protein